ncbi:MAG: cob(I)yrinic acid a,c-diamide adenosyltransferase, partial [Pseudomonadota bacterium]|nr:cob(I)yrinic acid a,c-diamide adenosyltransferase [Pseudomonadota bacterium]
TTRAGDSGQTTLGDGSSIAKTDIRVQAMAAVDELNAQLGFVKLLCPADGGWAEQIQHQLFDIGGDLCLPDQHFFSDEGLEALSADGERWNQQLPPLEEFVLPGQNLASSYCHSARTLCRRSEILLWQLAEQDSRFNISCAQFLNRLSDVLFILARIYARQDGDETQWQKRSASPSDQDKSSS